MSGTILITGTNRGIGLELATQYAAEGWRVHACCRSPLQADKLSKVAAASGERVAIHRLDVTDHDAIRALARRLGGEAIDILFSNAGIYGGERQDFGEVDTGAWLKAFAVNTIGPLKLAEAFAGHVARSRLRIIALMGTLMGSIGDNGSGGHYIYRSSKAALHMVGRSLAVDLRPRGISTVILHPGWVRTDMGGEGAPTSPAESVAGLRKVLSALTPAQSGRFFDYRGREIPW